jgi:hypothetical protein
MTYILFNNLLQLTNAKYNVRYIILEKNFDTLFINEMYSYNTILHTNRMIITNT